MRSYWKLIRTFVGLFIMKTLLQINTTVGWNSTGRIAENLGRMAIDAGWESYIAYGRDMNGRPQSASRLIKVGNRADMMAHGFMTRVFDRHGLASSGPTTDLIRRIDEVGPDVVHLHNVHGYYLNYEILFSYLSRTDVPVVWTFHDCWPLTGHCAYFDMAGCQRWMTSCGNCPLRNEYPASLFADRSAANHDDKRRAFTSLRNLHIVAVSDWLGGMIRKSYLRNYPVYVIQNGVDLPKFRYNEKTDEPVVLGVASKWETRKGLSDFIELRGKLPRNYKIILVGLSPKQLRRLPDGIEGHLREDEREGLYNWYRRASVFVNPSSSETLSLTNLEAQACGTPVVTYDSGGMSETITPATGLLVRRGDVDGLATAVMQVVSGGYSAEECRSHIVGNFNRADKYQAYLNLYEILSDNTRLKIPDLVLS